MRLWADRKIQVLPEWRGDSSPFVYFEKLILTRIKKIVDKSDYIL